MNNMKATLLTRGRHPHPAGGFVQTVVWQLPKPVPPSTHLYKYSLVYVVDGRRVIGFDNERGKGDHYHFEDAQFDYVFTGLDALFEDFAVTIERYNHGHRIGHGDF